MAAPETCARMAAPARLVRVKLIELGLNIIVEAHAPVAALSVDHASGAAFVHLKAFVDGAMTSEGRRRGASRGLRCPDIALLADVPHRKASPLEGAPQPIAAH